MPSTCQLLYRPGDGIEYIKADIEDGELTLQLENSSCRYILAAANLYRVLTENPWLPEKGTPPGAGLPGHDCAAANAGIRDHRFSDLALFHSVERHYSQRWVEVAVNPEQSLLRFPADLVLRLFHYAGLPDHGEGDGIIVLTVPEMEQHFSHPLADISAAEQGITALQFFALQESDAEQ